MPCSDITEILILDLNESDQIQNYSLIKKTCGGTVGNQKLILNWLKSKTPEDILETSLNEFLSQHQNKSSATNVLHEFMHVKHFLAVQEGLHALSGAIPSKTTDTCCIKEIKYSLRGIHLEAELKLKLDTNKIESCGKCATCGDKKHQ